MKIMTDDDAIDFWLKSLYTKLELEDRQGASDQIFGHIDRLCYDRKFDQIDRLLSRVDVEKCPTILRSWLSITDCVKEKLPSREALYDRIETKMIEDRGAETTQRLIGGLK